MSTPDEILKWAYDAEDTLKHYAPGDFVCIMADRIIKLQKIVNLQSHFISFDEQESDVDPAIQRILGTPPRTTGSKNE